MINAVPQGPRSAQDAAGAWHHDVALGALFLLSGALGLLYEIVWIRRLHLALGVSIFAVGAVVSVFNVGSGRRQSMGFVERPAPSLSAEGLCAPGDGNRDAGFLSGRLAPEARETRWARRSGSRRRPECRSTA